MSKILFRFKYLSSIVLSCAVIAVGYLIFTPKVYLAKSQVAIFRMKVENPDNGSDETRNRWIWIRDGLNINSALLDDEGLAQLLANNEVVKKATSDFQEHQSKIRFLKDLVQIKYTGADENNYLIETRSPNKDLALALNQHVFDKLKYLALQKDAEDFKAVVDKLNNDLNSLPSGSEDAGYYRNKLLKMKFEHAIFQTQKERAFQVISVPSVSEYAVWPKPIAILLVALFLGLVIGALAEFLVGYVKSIK